MRSTHLNNFKIRLAQINDYLVYFKFVSDQFNSKIDKHLENGLTNIYVLRKDHIKNNKFDSVRKKINPLVGKLFFSELELNLQLNNLNIDDEICRELIKNAKNNDIYIRDIFPDNLFANRYNKELNTSITLHADTNSFLFESIFLLVYSLFEEYCRNFYKNLQKIVSSLVKVDQTPSFLTVEAEITPESDLINKFNTLKSEYEKIGKTLVYQTKPYLKEQNEKDDVDPLSLKDINTTEIFNSILENLQVIAWDKIEKKYNVRNTSIPFLQSEYLTLEYFRLLRNTIVHRTVGNRYSGTISTFVDKYGTSLDDYWNDKSHKTNQNRRFNILTFKFSNINLKIENFDEIIDVLNIIRHSCIRIDNTLLNCIDQDKWIIYLMHKYVVERVENGKPFDTTNFERFYAKFAFYTQMELSVEFQKLDVEKILNTYIEKRK